MDLEAHLIQKLAPDRFRTSGKFHAILAHLLHQKWVTPSIVSLSVTSDGFLIARDEERGYDGGGRFLGTAAALRKNIAGMERDGIITTAERQHLLGRVPVYGNG